MVPNSWTTKILLSDQRTRAEELNNDWRTLPNSPSEELLAGAYFHEHSTHCWSLSWTYILCLEGLDGSIWKFYRETEELTEVVWLGWPEEASSATHYPPCLLAPRCHTNRTSNGVFPEETKCSREFSSKSTSVCHQSGLCSVAKRALPLKASFYFTCSSLLRWDRTIPQEAWFTIPSPNFYRAWLWKWNWWRPQPRVTESLGIAGDLQHLQIHPVIQTRVSSTCPWRRLPKASAELH